MSKYGYYLGMTPEQQDIVKMIREFAERELDPVVKEYDEKGEFPVQLHEKWGEMGLFGLDVPEQYGGLGLNAVTRYCISEELAKHDAGFTISNNSYSFGLSAILADGTEAQKQAACARILRGEGISMAITEPQSGSDVGSTRTSAKKVDGGYVLNGVKCFITNATLCSACVVLAVTNPDAGYHGMSLLLVEKSDAGVSVGKHEDKMGIRLSDTADFVMEDVFVPADRLIGTEGNGFAQTMKFLAGKRPVSVAGAVGVAQRALDLAVDYARERSFKHGPIAKLEGIQFLIADGNVLRRGEHGPAGLCRLWLQPRIPAGKAAARRAHLQHLRGHEPGAASGHRQDAARLRAVPREHSRLYQAGPGHDRDPHGSENQHPHPRRCAEHRQPL